MAAEGPVAKSAKANVNLSTADLALDRYVAITTEGESAGVEQLVAEDFNQKIQATNTQSNSLSEVIKLLKKQKGKTELYSKYQYPLRISRLYGG